MYLSGAAGSNVLGMPVLRRARFFLHNLQSFTTLYRCQVQQDPNVLGMPDLRHVGPKCSGYLLAEQRGLVNRTERFSDVYSSRAAGSKMFWVRQIGGMPDILLHNLQSFTIIY